MPLFMDRHEIPGATAEDAARAHMSDLEIATKHGVQFLSYWFDADKGGVFCFADAPSRDHLYAVHEASHGVVPNEIISVREDEVLRFLGRVHDPVDHTELSTPLRTILFTDLEGSTPLLEEVGEAAFMELLAEHDLLIRKAIVAAKGREVKHTGDGLLAAFDGVAGALDCSLDVRESFERRNRAPGAVPLGVRLGMAAGHPVDHNDDIYGSAVNMANRICAAADPGQVLVSEMVRDLGVDLGYAFDEGRRHELKGFTAPALLFELRGRVD